jgi:hypothetical protein
MGATIEHVCDILWHIFAKTYSVSNHSITVLFHSIRKFFPVGFTTRHFVDVVPFSILGGGNYRCSFQTGMKLTFHFTSAEDVLGDLGVRQAIRSMPKNARL